MKIVVLGGSGVFGERIARMLVRDGHGVVISGRREAPLKVLANEIGAAVFVLDRAGDLSSLWAAKPDLVIDAAGPFHAYGSDPYRLAREAIGAGVNYLDLADDAKFCLGIEELDDKAKAAGVFVLSGVSSVPALSSSVVAALSGDEKIDTIETAILPGNRAPRGQSVVDSILFQAGTEIEETVAEERTALRSWSDPRWFTLEKGLRRLGFTIRVPDQLLFPEFFGAKTVRFHAGLDLWVSNWGLAGFSWLRSKRGFDVPRWMSRGMRWAATRMEGFGSNEGGMAVDVTVQTPQGWQRRSWRLVAKAGDGPFIPGIPARVIARNPESIRVGARPALAEFTLAEAEAAMSDLSVSTTKATQKVEDIFETVLKDDFKALPLTIQDGHHVPAPRRFKGRASVERGMGGLERLAALIVGFPKATDDIEVEVLMIPSEASERWTRRFGSQKFYSTLSPQGAEMTEKFGPLRFTFDLHVKDKELHYPVVKGTFFGIPMPRWALPKSVSREYEEDGKFHFDVGLYAPLTKGLIVRYRGWLVSTTQRSVP